MPKTKKPAPRSQKAKTPKKKLAKAKAAPKPAAPKLNFMQRILQKRDQARHDSEGKGESQFHKDGHHFQAHDRVVDFSRGARRRSAS